MNKSLSRPADIVRFLFSAAAALVATLVAGLLLQPFNPFPQPSDPEFLRLLIGSCLLTGPALFWFVARSPRHGLNLLTLTLVVYIGSAQMLAHVETLAFNFLFGFSAWQLGYLVFSQALSALILVPLIVTIAGKWAPPRAPVEDRVGVWLPHGRSLVLRIALLGACWYVTYMAAGYFIADPVTHGYYAAKIADLNTINAWLPGLQFLRGVAWTLLFLLAVRVMNRPLPEAGLLAGLLFGVFHAAGLLLPNALMPTEMRLAHLPEIVASLVWQGGLTVMVMGWRRGQEAAR